MLTPPSTTSAHQFFLCSFAFGPFVSESTYNDYQVISFYSWFFVYFSFHCCCCCLAFDFLICSFFVFVSFWKIQKLQSFRFICWRGWRFWKRKRRRRRQQQELNELKSLFAFHLHTHGFRLIGTNGNRSKCFPRFDIGRFCVM